MKFFLLLNVNIKVKVLSYSIDDNNPADDGIKLEIITYILVL